MRYPVNVAINPIAPVCIVVVVVVVVARLPSSLSPSSIGGGRRHARGGGFEKKRRWIRASLRLSVVRLQCDAMRCGAMRCGAMRVVSLQGQMGATRSSSSRSSLLSHSRQQQVRGRRRCLVDNTDTGRKNVKSRFPVQNCDKSPVDVSSRGDSGSRTWTEGSGRDSPRRAWHLLLFSNRANFAHRPPARSAPLGRPKSRPRSLVP